MSETYSVAPIGHVVNDRAELGDDDWGPVESRIDLVAGIFEPEAMAGLAEFSHVEVVFLFHKVDPDTVHRGARHPRGNTNWTKVGVLAQRVKNRFNRLGVSRCEVLEVGTDFLRVRGLDAVADTPVLDIKPYMREFGPRGEVHQPSWSTEIMRHYY